MCYSGNIIADMYDEERERQEKLRLKREAEEEREIDE